MNFLTTDMTQCSLKEHCAVSSVLVTMFNCSGPCDELFHAKCAGIDDGSAKHLTFRNSGLFWLCSKCRKNFDFKLNLSNKFNSLDDDIKIILNKFKSISNDFHNFNKLSDGNTNDTEVIVDMVDAGLITNTDPITSIPINTNKKQIKNKRKRPTTSNSSPTSSPKRSNNNPSIPGSNPETNQITSLEPVLPSITDSPCSTSILLDIPPSTTSVNNPVIIQTSSMESPPVSPPTSSNLLAIPPSSILSANISTNRASLTTLRTVPKLKHVFVSKIDPSHSADDILAYLKDTNIINDGVFINCHKLKSKNAGHSSFKLTVTPDTFEIISKPGIWPANAFVKEFKPFNRRAQVSPPTQITNQPKN